MVINFEMFYLRAQVELEGVLGLQNYLRDLIKKIKPTGGARIASQTRQIKKAFFLHYSPHFSRIQEPTFDKYSKAHTDRTVVHQTLGAPLPGLDSGPAACRRTHSRLVWDSWVSSRRLVWTFLLHQYTMPDLCEYCAEPG